LSDARCRQILAAAGDFYGVANPCYNASIPDTHEGSYMSGNLLSSLNQAQQHMNFMKTAAGTQ